MLRQTDEAGLPASDPGLPARDDSRVLKVGELTRKIKDTLEGSFAGVWVEGEISNYTQAGSGHRYFSIKDEEATLRAVMFRGHGAGLTFQPANGTMVRAYGDVTVYPPRGEYQLKVTRLLPAGIGALQLAFEALKKKLQAEGLFDPARKRPLPRMPVSIGVVTSETGAAIRDILKVLRRRFPNISVTLAPCKVQGDGAAAEVAAGIEALNALGGFDVLIVGRGGGSLEDLWAFNEEVVARAIATSAIPIISAVGHEIDFTIADFVADVRAPTPSAAAELAVPDRAELQSRVGEVDARLERALTRKLKWLRERLDSLSGRSLFSRPWRMIEEHLQRVDDLAARLGRSAATALESKKAALLAAINRLEPVSPLETLKRGYCLVTRPDDARPLKDAAELVRGEMLRLMLARGTASCQVVEVEPAAPKQGEQGKLPLM